MSLSRIKLKTRTNSLVSSIPTLRFWHEKIGGSALYGISSQALEISKQITGDPPTTPSLGEELPKIQPEPFDRHSFFIHQFDVPLSESLDRNHWAQALHLTS